MGDIKNIFAEATLAILLAYSAIGIRNAWNAAQPTIEIKNAVVISSAQYYAGTGLGFKVKLEGFEKPVRFQGDKCKGQFKEGNTIDAIVIAPHFSNEMSCIYSR